MTANNEPLGVCDADGNRHIDHHAKRSTCIHWRPVEESAPPPVSANYMQRMPGGVCFAHGPYTEMECPKWPACATDPQKPEFMKREASAPAIQSGSFLPCTWMSYARGGMGWCSCGNFGSERVTVPYVAWKKHAANVPAFKRGASATAAPPAPPLSVFDKDGGGNSTFSRLEAEIEFNYKNDQSQIATDTSLTHFDLANLLKLVRFVRWNWKLYPATPDAELRELRARRAEAGWWYGLAVEDGGISDSPGLAENKRIAMLDAKIATREKDLER